MKKKGSRRSKKTKRSRSKGRNEECFKTKKEIRKNGNGEKPIRKHEVEKEQRKRNIEIEK